jgi:hypothetical protein
MNPELFKELFASFKDGSDEAIRSYLIAKSGFAPAGAKQVIAAFRDTLAFAGLKESSYNASIMSDKTQATKSDAASNVASGSFAGFSFPGAKSSATAVPNNAWTWTLSIPRNVKAELRIAGDVTKADIARLKKQIDFLEDSFDEEKQEA